MAFMKAPDTVVGDLLVDLGNLSALEMTIEHAIAIYDLALAYHTAHRELVQRRRDHLQGVLDDRRRQEWIRMLIFGAAAAGDLGLVGLCARVRRQRGQIQA